MFPYLGICLGMQIAVIEFATTRLRAWQDANSGEFDELQHAQGHRLHARTRAMRSTRAARCVWALIPAASCRAHRWRDATVRRRSRERHRHRYEFNNILPRHSWRKADSCSSAVLSPGRHTSWRPLRSRKTIFISAYSTIPEFKSRPNKAHPLFKGLISAALRLTQKEDERMHDRYDQSPVHPLRVQAHDAAHLIPTTTNSPPGADSGSRWRRASRSSDCRSRTRSSSSCARTSPTSTMPMPPSASMRCGMT